MEEKLTATEDMLLALEELNKRQLGKVQISKLYGFMEKYITQIDALDVSTGDDSHRDRRRHCVRKINAMLDTLNTTDLKVDSTEGAYPTHLGMAVVVGEESVSTRTGRAYLIDSEIYYELSGNYTNIAQLESVVESARAMEQVFVDRGLVSMLSSSSVISTHSHASLMSSYIQMTASPVETNGTPRTKVTHTHIAIAAHISRFLSEIADGESPHKYGFLSADSTHVFFSTMCMRGGDVSFEHFSTHELSSSSFTAATANSILRSAISSHDVIEDSGNFDMDLKTIYQIGCASPCMDFLKAGVLLAFPSIEWDGSTFGNSISNIAIAEAKGAALLAQGLVTVQEPSIFSYGIRSSEDDAVDSETFYMPFIRHWDALPVTVTKRLEPSAQSVSVAGAYEFDIMAQCCISAATRTVWRHRVVLPPAQESEAPTAPGSSLDVQVRICLNKDRSLFVSTCIGGVWSSETSVSTVCNALASPFDKASAISVVGVGGESFTGADDVVIRRGWCCKEESETLKTKGNAAFKDNRNLADDFHLTALEWYTLAVCYNPGNHLLYSNRAACAQKLGMYTLALKDSQASIRIVPTFNKGHVRCGDASFCLGNFSAAEKYYKAALNAAPSSDINDKMLAAIAQREKAEFEKNQASERNSNPRKKKRQGKGSTCVIA